MRKALFALYRALSLAIFASALSGAAIAEPLTYVESGLTPRFYPGDEDARLGRIHLLRGHYGLAEWHFRRAVEATPRNGAAWEGLAAAYDRLGRFDLAARAHRRAARLTGGNAVIANNRGYGQLLRGENRRARQNLHRAAHAAPLEPTIANNIYVMERGQDYFWTPTPVAVSPFPW